MRDRKDQDGQISENGGCSIGNPGPDLVDAMARKLRIPELLDGDANKDEEKDDADDPGNDEAPDDVGQSPEMSEMEDAVVHQQQTKLSPDEVDGVENLGDQQKFGHHDDIVHRNFVSVDAHTTLEHANDEAENHEVPSH